MKFNGDKTMQENPVGHPQDGIKKSLVLTIIHRRKITIPMKCKKSLPLVDLLEEYKDALPKYREIYTRSTVMFIGSNSILSRFR